MWLKGTDQDVDGEGHHEDRNEQICQCKRHNEVVGDGLEGSLAVHRQNDEDISKEREEREQHEDERPIITRLAGGNTTPRFRRVAPTPIQPQFE